jgi:hypothetical protein
VSDVNYYRFAFEGPIARFGVGKSRKVWYTVLFLPTELEQDLPFAKHPRLRVDGEIGDIPVTGAWMPTGDGRRYFIVAARVRKMAALRIGQRVEMRFRIADQDAVEVPPELTRALKANREARAAWESLTPGKRRGLSHPIHAAKTAATREKRVRETITALLAGD